MFDAHFHLRPDGDPELALKRFKSAGGTGLNLVCLPDYSLPADRYYEAVYDRTISMGKIAMNAGIEIAISLGPYPLDYFHWMDHGIDPVKKMTEALELAGRYITAGRATAIGEIGRPHFPVEQRVIDDSNQLIRTAFSIAKDTGCAVDMHTEDLDPDGIRWIETAALKHGLEPFKVIKHHANPANLSIAPSLSRSVLASRSNVRRCVESGQYNYMLETDFVDDPGKKDKVIPPDSVPRRVQMIRGNVPNSDEIFERIFLDLPEKIFGGYMHQRR